MFLRTNGSRIGPDSRTRIRSGTAAVVAAGLGLGLAGCGSTVSLTDPQAAPEVRAACERVIASVPGQVLGKQRRSTSGKLSAAWGEPPITLTCGLPQPDAMQRDSRCFEVNGIGWFADEGSSGWVFTTVGRRATVQVGVPNRYAPEAEALVDLSAAVTAGGPADKPCL